MKALKEVERRARLVEVLREGLGASEAELQTMFDLGSDNLSVLRSFSVPGM